MKARSKRLMLVGGGVALLFAAVALVLSAFQIRRMEPSSVRVQPTSSATDPKRAPTA